MKSLNLKIRCSKKVLKLIVRAFRVIMSIFGRNGLILIVSFGLWSLNFTIFMKLCLLFYCFTNDFTFGFNRLVRIFCLRLTFSWNQLIDQLSQCFIFIPQFFCEEFKPIFNHMLSSSSIQNFHNLTPMPVVVNHMLKETDILFSCPRTFINPLTYMVIPTFADLFWR